MRFVILDFAPTTEGDVDSYLARLSEQADLASTYELAARCHRRSDWQCPIQGTASFILMVHKSHNHNQVFKHFDHLAASAQNHPTAAGLPWGINRYIFDKKMYKLHDLHVPCSKAKKQKCIDTRLEDEVTTAHGAVTDPPAQGKDQFSLLMSRAKKRRLLPAEWQPPSSVPSSVARLASPAERMQIRQNLGCMLWMPIDSRLARLQRTRVLTSTVDQMFCCAGRGNSDLCWQRRSLPLRGSQMSTCPLSLPNLRWQCAPV